MNIIIILLILILNDISFGFNNKIININPTIGQPWPKPQSIITTTKQLIIPSDLFHFRLNETSETCDLLTNAFIRYYRLIFYPDTYLSNIINLSSFSSINNDHIHSSMKNKNLYNINDIPLLKDLFVNVEQGCDQWPNLESNESCKKKKGIF